MHAVADEHDTTLSVLMTLGPGLGVPWIVQLTPSQRSASCCCPWSAEPTARQAVAVGHETLLSSLSPPLDGLGVTWIDQLAPFHTSASVRSMPIASQYAPTPVQAVDDAHDTAFISTKAGVVALAVLWVENDDPVPCNAQV
jgi:hypothetical protein